MSRLNNLLVERARSMGARNVRIEHGGGRGSAGRFRRHPHLTGQLNGKFFKYPIKSRSRDASRDHRHNCLRDFEAFLRKLGGQPPPRLQRRMSSAAGATTTPRKTKTRRCRSRDARPSKVTGCARPAPTRLDLDPWEVLRARSTAHRLVDPHLNISVTAANTAAISNPKEKRMTSDNDNVTMADELERLAEHVACRRMHREDDHSFARRILIWTKSRAEDLAGLHAQIIALVGEPGIDSDLLAYEIGFHPDDDASIDLETTS